MATRQLPSDEKTSMQPHAPLKVALSFLEIYFSGEHLERLSSLMARDCYFQGPFFTFTTATDYIEHLSADPPVDCTFAIVKSFEDGRFANVIYEFSKPGVTCLMSQLFEFRAGKIVGIVLIFDTRKFSESP